jgi:hypothetical protein
LVHVKPEEAKAIIWSDGVGKFEREPPQSESRSQFKGKWAPVLTRNDPAAKVVRRLPEFMEAAAACGNLEYIAVRPSSVTLL